MQKSKSDREFDALAEEQQVPSIRQLPIVSPFLRHLTAFVNIFVH